MYPNNNIFDFVTSYLGTFGDYLKTFGSRYELLFRLYPELIITFIILFILIFIKILDINKCLSKLSKKTLDTEKHLSKKIFDDKISNISKEIQCPNCLRITPTNIKYCKFCGSILDKEQNLLNVQNKNNNIQMILCDCGYSNKPGDKYCANCSKKLVNFEEKGNV